MADNKLYVVLHTRT